MAKHKTERAKYAMVGPAKDQPCGIEDYSRKLLATLNQLEPVDYLDYRTAESALGGLEEVRYRGILLQYEASLVPDSGYLQRLGNQFPHRLLVIPHEVYEKDPFAFPYEAVTSPIPWVKLVKQWLYRRRHKGFFQELELQASGYRASGTIPLSRHTAEILRQAGCTNLQEPIPHAFEQRLHLETPPRSALMARRREFFPWEPVFLLGMFGFHNPALDYDTVFQVLAGGSSDVALLIVGGNRGEQDLERDIRDRVDALGLGERVRVTGYVPAENLSSTLSLCDAFVCPFKFKSNSGSIMELFSMNRPVIASSIPLTRELKKQGGPLELYRSPEELAVYIRAGLQGDLEVPDNRYPYDFNAVASRYLERLRAL